jgi:HAD superfamily hydrolase (TIGR01509 family)
MLPPVIELVIFDCDGVLVDSEITSCRCLAASLCEQGYGIDEAGVRERFLGVSDRAMLDEVERELGRPLPQDFLARLERDTLKAFELELQPIEGVNLALERLSLPCCVASSSDSKRIRRSLELTDLWDRVVPHVFSAAMVANGKPAPDLFLYAAAQMGASPGRSLVIEDSEVGVRAAKAAGMLVFGFTGGSHARHAAFGPQLEAAGADLVFDHMTRLPSLIARLVS